MSTTETLPRSDELQRVGDAAVEMAEGFTITSAEDYELAAGERKAVNSKIKELTERRLSITRKIDESKKQVMDLFAPALSRLEKAKSIFDGAMTRYLDAEDAKRRAAQAEADRRAAEERARLQAEADAQEAAAARARKPERIEELQAAAEATRAAASVVTAAPVSVPVSKVAGVGSAMRWTYEVEDLLAYVRFVATQRPDLISTLDIVPGKLRPVVAGLGENFKADGIRVFRERSIRS